MDFDKKKVVEISEKIEEHKRLYKELLGVDPKSFSAADKWDFEHFESELKKLEDQQSFWMKQAMNMTTAAEILQKHNIAANPRLLSELADQRPDDLKMLQNPNISRTSAKNIMTASSGRLQMASRNSIGRTHGFLLDGPLLAQGQAKSSLSYAYSESGDVLVAKIYTSGNSESFIREVNINAQFDHPNITKFVSHFSVDDKGIIVMPFYPRSVSDLAKEQRSILFLKMIKMIAKDCYEALCHIHNKGFCFANLKPSNIMLTAGQGGKAVLIDFGGVGPLGDEVRESSKYFPLDIDLTKSSAELDWTCLGTTLA